MESLQNSPLAGSIINSLGMQLPGVLLTLGILIVGVMVAKWVRGWMSKTLNKSTWVAKINPNNPKSISQSLSSLAYYVILLNVLLIVLERMNITSVLDPLKNLAQQFLGALPRIIGAAIIFYAGWVIAKLASSLVEVAAKKIDDILEEKGFEPDFKLSQFISAFVLGAVLLPIVVAGFEFLSISAISIPAIQMITEFMSAVPNIVGAGLILLVAYTVGRFVVYMMTGLLEGMNIDQLPGKMGFSSLMPEGQSLTKTVGSISMFFIMLAALTAAIDKLQIELLSRAFANLLDFGGGVVLGSVILLVGAFLANLAYNKINEYEGNRSLAALCRFAILGLVLAMGLKSMGLADNIVYMAFAFTFGSLGVASAVAFGLGGREAAQKITNHWATNVVNSPSKVEPGSKEPRTHA